MHERIGHRLARDRETLIGRNLHGQCQGGPEEENCLKLPGLVKRPKTKKNMEESCGSLIARIADGGEKREEDNHIPPLEVIMQHYTLHKRMGRLQGRGPSLKPG